MRGLIEEIKILTEEIIHLAEVLEESKKAEGRYAAERREEDVRQEIFWQFERTNDMYQYAVRLSDAAERLKKALDYEWTAAHNRTHGND